jgi:hypothetical protein
MFVVTRKTGKIASIFVLALTITACGGEAANSEGAAGEASADPHASLSVAADVMAPKTPAAGTEAEASAKR